MKKYLIILAILFATSFINAQTVRELLLFWDDNHVDTTPPSAPTDLAVVGGIEEIVLTWIDPTASDLAKVYIYRDAQLVTNGTFDSNVDGWTAQNATLTWEAGKMKFADATGSSYVYQGVQTTAGVTYTLTASATYNNGDVYIMVGSTAKAENLIGGTGFLDGSFSNNFIADGTTAYISLLTFGGYNFYDNFSIITANTATPNILIDSVSAGVLAYTDNNVTVGTTYNYRLKVRDANYNYSDYSAKASGIPE